MLFKQLKSQINILPFRIIYACSFVLFVYLTQLPTVNAFDKKTIGWLENIKINKSEFQLKAKIDTGATSSSLNSKILNKFKRNGQKWVRFRVENNMGDSVILEERIVRTVKIKRKRAFSIKRPVVNLGVCIGKIYHALEVNLSDRENFDFQMLIGRNYLHGYFLVDSALEYTVQPVCK